MEELNKALNTYIKLTNIKVLIYNCTFSSLNNKLRHTNKPVE